MSVKIVNHNNQEFIPSNTGIKITLWDTYGVSIFMIIFFIVIFCTLSFASIIVGVNMVMVILFPSGLIVFPMVIKFKWFSKLIMDMNEEKLVLLRFSKEVNSIDLKNGKVIIDLVQNFRISGCTITIETEKIKEEYNISVLSFKMEIFEILGINITYTSVTNRYARYILIISYE
jgi:hypothetical protein